MATKRKYGGYKNPEDYRRYMREYQRRHRARLSAQMKARRAANPDRYKGHAKQYRARNRDKINENRAHSRKIGGLITPAEYDALLAAQDGVCAICKTDYVPRTPSGHKRRRPLCVDHDHATGIVRGLLCYDCNVGLGRFKDSTERLVAALSYLHDHKG